MTLPQPWKMLEEEATEPNRLRPLPALDVADWLIPHRGPHEAQLVACTGKRGFGKTTFLQRWIDSQEPRVFALDPFNDFSGIPRCYSVADAFAVMKRYEESACRRRFVPPLNLNHRVFGRALFDRIFDPKIGLRDSLLLLDEITMWSDEHETVPMEKLVFQGRRIGIRMAVASQMISRVPRCILAEMTHLVVFNTTRPSDLETLEKWGGESCRELAPKLRVGECLLLTL